jgi:hypothetical protein
MNTSLYKELLDKPTLMRSSVNSGHFTTIHMAIKEGKINKVKTLIDNGADINETTSFGETPLNMAILNNKLEIALILIENGANINATNNIKNTALHMAISNRNTNIVLTLINNRCDINIQNKYGYTPLFLAIRDNKLTSALVIIHYGKIPYDKIPIVNGEESTEASEYIKTQYQMAKRTSESIISRYTRGLFTCIKHDPIETTIARVNIYAKSIMNKNIFYNALIMLRNKEIPSEIWDTILSYLCLPSRIDLNNININKPVSSGILYQGATNTSYDRTDIINNYGTVEDNIFGA